jgi:hypothetical protein
VTATEVRQFNIENWQGTDWPEQPERAYVPPEPTRVVRDGVTGKILKMPKAMADEALKQMPQNDYPVCIAKTQYSFSDDATKLGFEKGSRGFVGPARLF